MKDQAMNDAQIKYPRCRKTYKGKHVNNPMESSGVCDRLQMVGETVPEMKVTRFKLGPDGKLSGEIVEEILPACTYTEDGN